MGKSTKRGTNKGDFMEKRELSIYWYINLVLLFFICCKFSPISNKFMSSVFDNMIVNYLMVILNVIVGKCAYNRYKKISKGMILNLILSVIFILIAVVDYSELLRKTFFQALFVSILYLICYLVIIKLDIKKNLIVVLSFSILATIFLAEVQYIKANEKCDERKNYSFTNEKEYKKCKELYNNLEKMSPYIVLGYTNNSVYVRDLTSGQTDYYSFENEKE